MLNSLENQRPWKRLVKITTWELSVKAKNMKREAVGGIWNTLESGLETRPELLLQSEASLEVPPVAAVTGRPRCAPSRGQAKGFRWPDWNWEMRGTSHRLHLMLSKRAWREGSWIAAQSTCLNDAVEAAGLYARRQKGFFQWSRDVFMENIKKKKKKKTITQNFLKSKPS